MVLSELSFIYEKLSDIEIDNNYDFSGVKEELGLTVPATVAKLDDGFTFDDDESVPAKKLKKKLSKKTRKSFEAAPLAFDNAERLEGEEEELNF